MKISMFWVAFYKDGTALPQFDLETGKEHLFSEVEFDKLERLMWCPFPLELAEKVGCAMINPLLPLVSVKISDGCKPKIFRRTRLDYSMTGNTDLAQEVEEYIIGLEGNPLVAKIKRTGEVELAIDN